MTACTPRFSLALLAVLLLAFSASCPGETEAPSGGICLLNSCDADEQCRGCPEGRDACDLRLHRCVECDGATGTGCPSGESCTQFGVCIPTGQTCPTDADGLPTLTCVRDTDCAACGPDNQICNNGRCVECVPARSLYCLASEYCAVEECEPRCPTDCASDRDCNNCGSAQYPSHACFAHRCAECSPTTPCPSASQVCVYGDCIEVCGLPGPVAGDCVTDADCSYCGDPEFPEAWNCNRPVNNPAAHGTCGPPATGCSDLGAGAAVLPRPWSEYTQLCSTDGDCAGIDILFDVGEVIRDLVGGPTIDLGFTTVTIHDAYVAYDMSECAEVTLGPDLTCGVCVPCQVDSDCEAIPLDPVIFDLFRGEILASLAGALLIDLFYAEGAEHLLHMYCQPIAGGYGVCAPCGNPTQACGVVAPPSGGTCDHEVCSEGTPLGATCGGCTEAICAVDSFCCSTAWDSTCVAHVDTYCASGCGGASSCGSDLCTVSQAAQDPLCGPCAASVCGGDSFCCNEAGGAWDSYCVSLASEDPNCAAECSGGCAHDECTAGGPLAESCSICATTVCATDPYCCTTDWDSYCVDIARPAPECPICP